MRTLLPLLLFALLTRPALAQLRPANLTMPGKSFKGELPKLTEEQAKLRDALRADVEHLAGKIGERNVGRPAKLAEAAAFVEKSFAAEGYKVEREKYPVRGVECLNLWVELAGAESPKEIVLVGAHYDSVSGCPAANDNGSGVAALLALARHFAKAKPGRTLRLVAFTNEEQPYFQTDLMGSYVHAKGCKARKEKIVAMLSLETLGYYSDREGSQKYPALLGAYYPTRGNFAGFVGDLNSAALVKQMIGDFRTAAKFPSEGAALPGAIPGVGWSDHWSFWQFGYQGVMVTDTAPFRYPHYHQATDTPDKLDYDRLARVVEGLFSVVTHQLATPAKPDPTAPGR
jgi:hypothetical protein